jgi:hypothetical protein
MVYSLARRAFRRAAGSPAASGALEVGGGGFPVSGHGPGHWGAAACERPARRRLTRASSAPPSPTEVSTWPPKARSRSRGPLSRVTLAPTTASGAVNTHRRSVERMHRRSRVAGDRSRSAGSGRTICFGHGRPVQVSQRRRLHHRQLGGRRRPPASRARKIRARRWWSSAGNTTVLTFGQDPYIANPRRERKASSVSPKGAQRTVADGAGIHGFMGAHEQPSFSELVQR